MNYKKEIVSVFASYDKQKEKKCFFINGDENYNLISYICSSEEILKRTNVIDMSIVFKSENIGKCEKQDFLDIFNNFSREEINIKSPNEDEIYNYFINKIRKKIIC